MPKITTIGAVFMLGCCVGLYIKHPLPTASLTYSISFFEDHSPLKTREFRRGIGPETGTAQHDPDYETAEAPIGFVLVRFDSNVRAGTDSTTAQVARSEQVRKGDKVTVHTFRYFDIHGIPDPYVVAEKIKE